MPLPKVSCGAPADGFVMSKVSGSSNAPGSKLAAAKLGNTNVPAGNSTSRYTMSSEA